MRLVLVALAVALIAVACKVDTTVTITVRDDGSGTVRVTTALDPDAVKSAEARGGTLEDGVRLADLSQAGWTVAPWARAEDGSARLTISKPFDEPSQVAGIVEELSGTLGPLRDVTVTRDQGTFSTTYSADGTLDLANLQTDVAKDPDIVGSLLTQQVDVGVVDQALLADLRESLGVTVKLELPGASSTVVGTMGQSTPIDESTSVLDTTRVVLVAVAVGLVVLAVVVLLWPGRRRRRATSRRGRAATLGTSAASRTRSSRPRGAAPPPSGGPS